MNNPTPAIRVKGLAKSFGGKRVVDGINIEVPRGTIFGFLGPNGSGKTTTIRLLCGLLTPDAGEGECLGFDIRRQSWEIKQRVGYMTQRFGLYEDLTVRENLEFVGRMYNVEGLDERTDQALDEAGLSDRADQKAGELSGGWKQRLALAACTLHRPELLLLDEPTAGVDPNARREFWGMIHQMADAGVTVLVSTHHMDEAERCHRIGYIAWGRLLLEGTVSEVVERAGLSTWAVSGADLTSLEMRLKGLPGVDLVAAFGSTLHVTGTNPAILDSAVAPFRSDPNYTWQRIKPSLEDVFIRTLTESGADRS